MWRNLLDLPGKIRPAWVLLGVIGLATALRLWQLDVLPPGLFFDEAYNGFDARQILQGGPFPLFFAGNNGREPLFIYLQAVSVAVLGATPYALRVVAALTGIITIPVVYFCAVTLLTPRPATPQQRRLAGWLGLVAAAGLTVSYWHLSLSRLGFRVNLLIPISALTIAFLWRAWTGQRRRNYAWAGIWLGLGMYTYIAARLLPFVILAFFLIEWLVSLRRQRFKRDGQRAPWRPRLAGLLVLAGVAVVVALPLAWTFLANPALLSARTGQVSIWSGASGQWLGDLLANVLATARAFYDQGDQNLRHNLPGRPVNDLLLAVLFTLGWLSALLTVVNTPRSRLLLLWFAIMLAPTVLSSEAPQYLRSAGALPPLAIFYALGAESMASLWSRAARRPATSESTTEVGVVASAVLLLLVLSWSGTRTALDYFQRWASLPGLGAAFDVDNQLAARAAAELLDDPAQAGMLLMSAEIYLQPQMGFALGPVAAGALPPTLTASATGIPLLQEDNHDPRASLMLVTRQDEQTRSIWLQPLGTQYRHATAAGSVLRWPIHQPGWPQVTQVMLPANTPLALRQIRYPLDVAFANGLRLVGYDVEPDVLASGQGDARLTLFWQVDGTGEARQNAQEGEWRSDFDVFAHLNTGGAVAATANGQLRGQALAERLHAGQPLIEDVRRLAAPAGASADKAHFEVGLYHYRPGDDSGANERIPIVDPNGQAAATQVDLGAVWLSSAPAPNLPADLLPLGVQFDQRIELAGAQARYDGADTQRLLVDLGWQALDRSTTGYTAFVHLLDAAGQIVAQYDAPPGGEDNPTNLWAPGETVRATFPLALPAGLDSAGLQLRIGLYEPVSGRQIPITAGAAPAVDTSSGLYLLVPLQHLERSVAP
jgi:hypothetical protein